MRALEPWHLLILAVVFIALFGAKRLPDSARSLGESLHIFKKTLREGDAVPDTRTVPPVPPKQVTGSVSTAKPPTPESEERPNL